MADLISRSAALNALELCDFIQDKEYENGARLLFEDSVKERLQKVPSEEPKIIRCIDCVYFDEDTLDRSGLCGFHLQFRDDDDFCSNAKRKETTK